MPPRIDRSLYGTETYAPSEFEIQVSTSADVWRSTAPPSWATLPTSWCGPPSWTEKQRVGRLIWRIIFYFELRKAVVNQGLLGWKKEDVERFRNLSAEEFWDELVIGGEKEETAGNQLPPWVIPRPYLRGQQVYCCLDYPPTTEADWKIAQKNLALFYYPGFAFGKQSIANLDSSPLKRVDFAVFRPYGFAIWNLKKMTALGFLGEFYYTRDNSAQNPSLSGSNLFFTWESILTRTQLEEVERKQKEQWYIS